MPYSYVTIDGHRVEAHAAAAYREMAAAFAAHTFKDGQRYTLGITSGVRTRVEQEALYKAWLAYRRGGPSAALAAIPGTSRHEADGPAGPRAIDIHDSGADAGVTTVGTERADYLRRIAPSYGFDPAGYRFTPQEAWHYEYTGSLTEPRPATPASTSAKPIEEEPMPDYNVKSAKTGQKLPAGKWVWAYLNEKHDVSWLSGAWQADEKAWVRIKGLPAGSPVRLRWVRSEIVAGKKDEHHYGAPVKLPSCGDDTCLVVPDTTDMGAHSRLRLQLMVEEPATLASVLVKIRTWKK